jgi:hypothetical protein
MRDDGYLRSSSNRSSGAPYTQFAVRRKPRRQELFYRLDRKVTGPYLALRVYTRDALTPNHKRDWEKLKKRWVAMANSAGVPTGKVQNRYQAKTRERTVTEYRVADAGDSWRDIVATIRATHPLFVTDCRNAGLLD